MRRNLIAAAAAAVVIAGSIAAAGMPARAASAGCQAAAGCASYDTPVQGGMDLDALNWGGTGRPGTAGGVVNDPVVVWSDAGAGAAGDWDVIREPAGEVLTESVSPVVPVAPPSGEPAEIVYAPDGVASGLCVSVVTSTVRAHAALRPCDMSFTAAVDPTYNPYQTFYLRPATDGDGEFTVFENVIDYTGVTGGAGLVLNDMRSGGNGSPVISYPAGADGTTPNQLWEANG
jgi:hypothetical protein